MLLVGVVVPIATVAIEVGPAIAVEEMRRIFEAHLEEPAAALALAQATELAKTKRIALLCYEDDPDCCHRRIVADRILRACESP